MNRHSQIGTTHLKTRHIMCIKYTESHILFVSMATSYQCIFSLNYFHTCAIPAEYGTKSICSQFVVVELLVKLHSVQLQWTLIGIWMSCWNLKDFLMLNYFFTVWFRIPIIISSAYYLVWQFHHGALPTSALKCDGLVQFSWDVPMYPNRKSTVKLGWFLKATLRKNEYQWS